MGQPLSAAALGNRQASPWLPGAPIHAPVFTDLMRSLASHGDELACNLGSGPKLKKHSELSRDVSYPNNVKLACFLLCGPNGYTVLKS
jgi:hypothetical protein